jgi:hypothetical protein
MPPTAVRDPKPLSTEPSTPPAQTHQPQKDPTPLDTVATVPTESDGLDVEKKGLLAEIALIALLIKEERKEESKEGSKEGTHFAETKALQRLRLYLKSTHDAVKKSAQGTLQPIEERLTQRIQTQLKTHLDKAKEHLNAERFSAAQKTYEEAVSLLKAETSELPILPSLLIEVETLQSSVRDVRAQRTIGAFKDLEEALMRKDVDAEARLKVLLVHEEEAFSAQAKQIQKRVDEKRAAERVELSKREVTGRQSWLEFYKKFHAAMTAADFEAAKALLEVPPDSPMWGGGVPRPQEVIAACLSDLYALNNLLESVRTKAATLEHAMEVELPLKKGRPVEGKLTGVKGRLLTLTLPAGADLGVRVETLNSMAIANVLGKDAIAEKKLLLRLSLHKAYDAPLQSEAALKQSCKTAELPMPLNWSEFYRLEAFAARAVQLEQKFSDLQKMLDSGDKTDVDVIKDAITALKPLQDDYEKTEPLDPKYQKILADATRLIGQSQRIKVILQNGSKPYAEADVEYTGQSSDQVSEYKDSQRKSDVGVQWGLKVGASGGLQRVLLRFDGLENAIGKARIVRATLEMFQIESLQSNGSVVGIFRLKRPWLSDNGSWLFYNTDKKLAWETPGAIGDKDSEAKEEARITLDATKNVWRSWDITPYIQDVLKGKTQNYGFLMRVINGEPDFHIRFYPESDVENIKDAKLRPRLVLDLEREKKAN